MLGAVADAGGALAAQSAQLSRAGPGDHRVGLLRLTVLEDAGALQHKAPSPGADASDESLETDERRRPVVAVHHQILDLRFSREITGERLGDAGAGHFGQARALTVGLFIPALEGEARVRRLLHGSGATGGPSLGPAALSVPGTPPIATVYAPVAAVSRVPNWSR